MRFAFLTGSILSLLAALFCMQQFARGVLNDTIQIEAPAKVSHRILFISSYDPLYFTYEFQRKGIESGLYPSATEYDVVYMDTKNYGTPKDIQAFHDFLKKRLSETKRRYEAVLIGDDAALEFALMYQKELFPEMPIVFFGINNLELAVKAAQNPYITGFYEQNYLKQTLDLTMRLFPEIKHFVGLHDRSVAGIADYEIFSLFPEQYPDFKFTTIDVSKMTQSQMLNTLEHLSDDSILIYMTCYSDVWGNNYSIRDRTRAIAEHTKRPIVRNYVCVDNIKLLGGIYMDFEVQCNMAARLVIDILNGRKVASIPLHLETPPRVTINYQLMKDYRLDFSKLPPETVFYNKPVTFLSHYGPILPSISLLVLALLMLLAMTYTVSLSRKATERELRESHEELERSHQELEKSHEELRYQAENDESLGILNRRAATEHLNRMLSPADVYSIIMVDIDSFKELNESFGHQVADSILEYMTAVFRRMSTNWLLARYGGDEFLLMLPGEQLSPAHPLIERLMDNIRAPIPLGDESINITASIGISVSDGETTPEQHIHNAESAMYEAKNHGKNGAALYDEELKAKSREELQIKAKLQEAFENDGFYMLFQPQISSQTKKVVGYEALVRMKEPGMYPGAFIPVAEKNGWIWRIGRITTELVIKQLAQWKQQGHELHPVSVNFSSNQLNDHGYVDFVISLLKTYDVPPEYLEIEITEGLFLEKSALADKIFNRFKEIGIRLLMDDFGTGYSSLGYLSYIPVDVIKLDKTLVDTYLVTGKDFFIRDVIQMMHDLGKEMIIEGVEYEWQFLRLRDFGADTIQGYYFSKPIPPEAAISFTVAG
ncbi:MAG: bifunctional diguanylate cyclase/phosphodiesterase [Treponema sp.]|nr:bifunctional diguanylate cyclase/phosphodiesterase [Treponema sp.]